MRAREPLPGRAVLGAMALIAISLFSPTLLAQTDCAATSPDGLTTVEVRILQPESDGLLALGPYSPCNLPVEGIASAVGIPPRFDIFLVLDTSGSTEACSGADIDGDGVIGEYDPVRNICTDRGDSVLAAEVAGAMAFLDVIEFGPNRVGVIGFSDPNLFGSTITYMRLTDDRAAVEAALGTVQRVGSRGATDFESAQDLLRGEMTTFGRPDVSWVGLFLSDGWPTFPVRPYNSSDQGDWEASVDAADRLAAEGIRLFTFGVGVDAGEPVLRDMALHTGGRFAKVVNPGDLRDALPATVLTGLAGVLVSNRTVGVTEMPDLTPAGEFSLVLPAELGWNELEVDAFASDGDHTQVTCPVRVYLACATGCQAKTQGFWHRQCKATGEIQNGRSNTRLLVEEFPGMAEAVSGVLSFSGQDTCTALDADPSSSMCEKALKQYAALLLNMAWGILGPDCVVDLSYIDPSLPSSVGGAVDVIEESIREGSFESCVLANDIADAINTEKAIDPSVAMRMIPYHPSFTPPAGTEPERR